MPDENKSDVLNDIITRFPGYEERRRRFLTIDELATVYRHLRGGKEHTEMTTADYRRCLVKMAYDHLHPDQAPPTTIARYHISAHGNVPALSRPHAEEVRALVEDTTDSQVEAVKHTSWP